MWSVIAAQPGSQSAALSVTVEPEGDLRPGDQITYRVDVVSPTGLAGADWRLVAPIPSGLVDARWTCTASGDGYACGAASGSGDLDEVVSLGVDGQLTFVVTGTVDPSQATPFTFEVTLVPPAGIDCERRKEWPVPPPPSPSEVESAIIPDDLTGLTGQLEDGLDDYGAPADQGSGLWLDEQPLQAETEAQSESRTLGWFHKKKPGVPCRSQHTVTPQQPEEPETPPQQQLPVTGAPAVVLTLFGAGTAVAGGALWWWTSRRRQLRRLLRG